MVQPRAHRHTITRFLALKIILTNILQVLTFKYCRLVKRASETMGVEQILKSLYYLYCNAIPSSVLVLRNYNTVFLASKANTRDFEMILQMRSCWLE